MDQSYWDRGDERRGHRGWRHEGGERGRHWHHERREGGEGEGEGRGHHGPEGHHDHDHRGGRHFGPPWAGRGFGPRMWRGPFHFGPRGGRGGPFGGGPGFGRGGPFGGGPGGPGGPFDEDGGRRRQKRGDIKFALLELLAEQPRHGYDLIRELEQRYGGFYRPSPGSVYPTLQLLEDEGHLTSEVVEGKRIYTVTESGSKLLAERREQGGERGRGPWRGIPEELNSLRQSVFALMEVVMQAARHGTPEQVKAVQARVDATRREVYAILAREEPTSEG